MGDLKVTLDANWRWLHHSNSTDNCYEGDQWDSTLCSDPLQCARDCVLEGVSLERYQSTYGIEQIENGVKLNFVTDHADGTNVGSRLYMLDESGEKYKMFYLKNREFAMTFDVSHAFCGMNGAMYFVEMDQEGGKGLGANAAGAAYGTGYCDAQCPHDIKFISGEANSIDWNGNPDDPLKAWGLASTALAVQRWTSGRRTAWQMRTLLIRVTSPGSSSVRAPPVATMSRASGMMVSATKTVVISTHTGWATGCSSAAAQSTRSTH